MSEERGIDGARVRELRRVRGWTQKDLERESGVAQSTLSRLERGDSQGSYAATLRSLARALGCSDAYLTGDAEAPGADFLDLAAFARIPAWAAEARMDMTSVMRS